MQSTTMYLNSKQIPTLCLQPLQKDTKLSSSSNAPPLHIKKINHIAVEAQDVDQIAQFYMHVLGFRALPRPDLGFRGYWLHMPHVMLHIIERDPSIPRNSDLDDWKKLYKQEPEAWFIRASTLKLVSLNYLLI